MPSETYWPFSERCAREDRPLSDGTNDQKPDDLYIKRDMFEHRYVCRRRDIFLHRYRSDAKLLEGTPKKRIGADKCGLKMRVSKLSVCV